MKGDARINKHKNSSLSSVSKQQRMKNNGGRGNYYYKIIKPYISCLRGLLPPLDSPHRVGPGAGLDWGG